jgi:hypothetical protein
MDHIGNFNSSSQTNLPAVTGTSTANNGVRGVTSSAKDSAVFGVHSGQGVGVFGTSVSGIGVYGQGSPTAGFFEGNLEVTGDIQLVGADCAEQFEVHEAGLCDPGTVMVIEETGVLVPSRNAYDQHVAGIISGAGEFRPGLILDRRSDADRCRPIALVGKACCKAVAVDAPIAVGDLLTTSGVAGHAMKATDRSRAFGAIIGKALQPLASGTGLVRILIALQ